MYNLNMYKTMKKTYIIPRTCIDLVEVESHLAVFSDGVSSDGIGYGGVDTDGTVVPETKRHQGVWDKEW